MSRIIPVLFLLLLANCGGSGGNSGSSGPVVSGPGSCPVKVERSQDLKAIAKQFYALQSKCALSDEDLERRIDAF
jgi:hypothetical protein